MFYGSQDDISISTKIQDSCQNFFKKKLDLRIEEPMQICIHQEDNSTKPVNHHLTLKEGPKVKSDIKRFTAHDILQFGFTLQTSRINNKRVISTFKLAVLV